MEQTRETQLASLYNVLGFRRVIARYGVKVHFMKPAPGASVIEHTYDIITC